MLAGGYVFAYFADWASGDTYLFYGADVFWEDVGTSETLTYFSGAANPFDLCAADAGYTDADGAVTVWLID